MPQAVEEQPEQLMVGPVGLEPLELMSSVVKAEVAVVVKIAELVEWAVMVEHLAEGEVAAEAELPLQELVELVEGEK